MYRSNRSFDVLPRTNPWVFELLNIGLCKSPAPPRGKIVQKARHHYMSRQREETSRNKLHFRRRGPAPKKRPTISG